MTTVAIEDIVTVLRQAWDVPRRPGGSPIQEPVSQWVPAVRTKYSDAERQRLYNTWLQQYSQDHSDLPQTRIAFKEWALQKIAAEPPNRNVVTDYADLDRYIASEGVGMTLEGGRKRRRTHRRNRKSTRGSRLP